MALLRLAPLAAGLLLPAAASTSGGEATAPPDADIDTVRIDEAGLLRDSKGRARIFHGTNVVYKEAPFYPPSGKFTPDDSLDPKTMDLMRKWGFNVVRLGVMWNGVEPSKGNIDNSYLNAVAGISRDLARRGIYTLVDLHQDVGSRRFCGEGFPEFYVDDLAADSDSAFSKASQFPSPQHFELPLDNQTNLPALSDCTQRQFFGYYFTNKVGAMWAELYRTGSPLNEGFSRYWSTVSQAFANEPHVLGYELLNEPSGYCLEPGALGCTDVVHELVGNKVEAQKLTPLYRAAAKAIRQFDKDTPIFYEPTPVPKAFADAFPEPALGDDPQQGLGYHIYCAPGDGDSTVNAFLCERLQDLMVGLYYKFLHKHKGVAGFLTEFGAVAGSPLELKHLTRLLDRADQEFQSWAYWMVKKYHDFTTANADESMYDKDGNLNVEKLKVLSRTYAPAIAGDPTKMRYDATSGHFELTFVPTVTDAPTVVYLNEELNYPSGFEVEVSHEGCLVQSQREAHYLEFILLDNAGCFGHEVTISISRKRTDDVYLV